MSEASNFVDYYELLGVKTDAEPVTIRQAFLQQAKEHHPDRGGTTEQMQVYTAAYRTLMSATSRKAYDLLHDFHSTGTKAQYKYQGAAPNTLATDDLDDDEIDDFLDQVFAEYHGQSKPKKSLLTRIKQLL